uniref:BESS domain-containing protein n=1 Tax=Sander lucioperca TaxID=283035 RepID=A0A8D0AND6_SANLU
LMNNAHEREHYSLCDKEECKKMWKNLRDRYLKERRQQREKSGVGADHKSTWKYFSILVFLEPHVRERATTSNLSQSWCQSQPLSLSPQEGCSTYTLSQVPLDSGDEFDDSVLNALQQNTDDTEPFLLSLAPRLRNLHREKRSEVQMEFLATLHRAEFS